jgi:hypothetical protein
MNSPKEIIARYLRFQFPNDVGLGDDVIIAKHNFQKYINIFAEFLAKTGIPQNLKSEKSGK